MKDYQYLQQKYIVNTYPNRGLTLVKGKGVYLYDLNGKKYLDLMSNYGVSIFGYNYPNLTKSLIAQLKKLPILHGSFNNDIRSEAAMKLIEITKNQFSQVYFSNSGAEAIEAAIKFVLLATGKRKIIVCEHSYHGKTLGALALTYGDKYRKPFEPFALDVEFIKYNDVSSLGKKLDSRTAAFFVEPVQGEGGLLTPKKGFLNKVRELCNKRGVLLVFDEIQSGTGRTGKFLACQWENVYPDLLCLGKGLAAGIPIGVTLVNKFVSNKIVRNIHTSTFGGNPLSCAGIINTLKQLDKNRLKYIKEIGDYFFEKLDNLKSELISGIRGKGLMLGIEIKNNKRNEVLKLLQKNNILAIPAGDTVVRFLPPYIIEIKHIDEVIEKLVKILKFL